MISPAAAESCVTTNSARRAGPWWREAVVYQVYPRSFADADASGEGDLSGIRSRLPYLADLGVDAIWLNPFYPSPMHDSGYDIADYCGVDARFGTLEDFDILVRDATALGIRVIIDIVPNHCSSQHPWFREAMGTGPGSEARKRFIFRDAPNNWQSLFGGPAWTRTPDGPFGQERDSVAVLSLAAMSVTESRWPAATSMTRS